MTKTLLNGIEEFVISWRTIKDSSYTNGASSEGKTGSNFRSSGAAFLT